MPRHPAYGKQRVPPELITESPNVRDIRSDRSPRGRSLSPPPAGSSVLTSNSKRDYWFDQVPAEELKFMQEVSRRIRDHGPGLLDTLKERERENPKFDFLFEKEVSMFHGSN